MAPELNYMMYLTEAVQLLAADADTQVALLPRNAATPTEIKLIYSECALMIPELLQSKLITKPQADALRRLNSMLDQLPDMSEHAGLAAIRKSLATDPKWNEVRMNAVAVLHLLGMRHREPDLSWLTFSQGGAAGRRPRGKPKSPR